MPLAGRSLAVPGLLVAAVRELGGIHRDDPTAFLALIDEVLCLVQAKIARDAPRLLGFAI